MVTVDFETEAIDGNPILSPPVPVGVALHTGNSTEYLAWGHPSGNNASRGEALQRLSNIRDSGVPLLFHNAAFDLSVWNEHCGGISLNDWNRYHDTMYLLFLADPYSTTLSLKPSAARWLGLPPTEQTELVQWIVRHVPGATLKTAGAYICRAPGELVGRYAIGDVVRTRSLFDLLHSRINEQGMGEAYDRERRLFPVLVDSTRRGIRIDRAGLSRDCDLYEGVLVRASRLLADKLGVGVAALDEEESFANALESSGAVKEWTLTPKSKKRSLSKENLKIEVPEVKVLMDYRGGVKTCLETFYRPWLESSAADGRLHPNWNQVKQAKDDRDSKGTKTGRLSSDSPNFQNVPTKFVYQDGTPLAVPEGLPPLPLMRQYCLPEEGHVWLKRDFSGQELRILAHFEDGSLLEAYRADATLDVHNLAQKLIQEMIGVYYARKSIKITGFSLIYGTGVRGLSGQLGVPYDEAGAIKSAYLAALPGVKTLMDAVQRRGRNGDSIRTSGGRVYFVEPAKIVGGQRREFAYKLLNYLIQGSAADQTKQSIIDWEAERSPTDVFTATVHDEINISVPAEDARAGMERLRSAMNKDRFDVPFLSEGFIGPNWHELTECA